LNSSGVKKKEKKRKETLQRNKYNKEREIIYENDMSLPLLTFVEARPYKFLIMDAPRTSNIPEYLREMKKRRVTDIVRVCEEETYKKEVMENANIKVYDFAYKDGTTPPKEVLTNWLELCSTRFQKEKSTGAIAIHCVAGLGRAPLLVAIAIIESGRDYTDAVSLIRQKRSGCINKAQLEYLKSYKPMMKSQGCCVVS